MNLITCEVCGASQDYIVTNGPSFVKAGIVVCSNCGNSVDTLENAQDIATPDEIGVGVNDPIPPFRINITEND